MYINLACPYLNNNGLIFVKIKKYGNFSPVFTCVLIYKFYLLQKTSVSLSIVSDSHSSVSVDQCGFEDTTSANSQGNVLSTKLATSQGVEAPALRSSIPTIIGSPITPVTLAQMQGSSLKDRTPSVLLGTNLKTNETAVLGEEFIAVSVESQKNTNTLLTTSNTLASNGFTGYPPVTCTSTVLSRYSPHSAAKVPLTINTITNCIASTATSIPKTSFSTGSGLAGSASASLVFHNGPPPMPHLGTGLPMLIQATPYRTPYANYSLYTPYSSIGHGQYLQSVLPLAAPNTSSSQHRLDARNIRESPSTSSLKPPVTSAITSQQHNISGISGLRPVTPLSYVISNNNTAQTSGTVSSITSTTVPLLNSNHPHHLSVYTAGAFGVSTTGAAITTSPLMTPVVTSITSSPQLIPATPVQLMTQSGYSTHLPQLLNSYSQFTPPTQPILRSTATSTIGTSNNSAVSVQHITTAIPSSSITATVSTASVIQKILSPKSESSSRDRDAVYR